MVKKIFLFKVKKKPEIKLICVEYGSILKLRVVNFSKNRKVYTVYNL